MSTVEPIVLVNNGDGTFTPQTQQPGYQNVMVGNQPNHGGMYCARCNQHTQAYIHQRYAPGTILCCLLCPIIGWIMCCGGKTNYYHCSRCNQQLLGNQDNGNAHESASRACCLLWICTRE